MQKKIAIPCDARPIKLALLVWLFLLLASLAKAGHVSGVDLSYECINGCTVRVNFRAYRDCSSPISNISPIGTLFIKADSGCTMPTQIGAWVNASNSEVTPVCPGTATGCNTPGAPINGIMEHYWFGDFDFCAANCSTYTIEWGTCCRNSNSTLFLPQSTGLYVSTTFNPFLLPCNSSPTFNNPPLSIICQGQSYVFSQGASDPDGDSLSYSLGPCQNNASTPVSYLSWAGPTLPLTNDWNVAIDSSTGDLSFSPNPSGLNPGSVQVGVICIYVEEWRNGVLINTIVRDMQVTVTNCPPNETPNSPGAVNISGATGSGFVLNSCLGANICFDIPIADGDSGQIHTVTWNQQLAALGATFVDAANPTVADTIIGNRPVPRFCWTPTAPGNYSFVMEVKDDACPVYGIAQYTFNINVTQMFLEVIDSVTACKDVVYCAEIFGGNMPYHYNWTGNGGIAGNPGHVDSCFTHIYPNSGTFFVNLTVTDLIGCTATGQDTVVISNNVRADAGPDLSTCSNQPTILGIAPQTSPNLVYSWSPSIGLGNPNMAQPTLTASNNGTQALQLLYVLRIEDTLTYCFDEDSMIVTVYPIPNSTFNLQDTACQYATVGLAYMGGSAPSATYLWTFQGGTPATASGQGPQQVSFASPGPHDVTLSVTENGCPSPLEHDTIYITQVPVASILPVADQCLVGNSFNFTNIGIFGPNATHHWTFGPNASPNTSTAQNPSQVVFSTSGPKMITLSTTEGSCTSLPDTQFVTINPTPNALWNIQGGFQCWNGNSYDFLAHAGNGPTASYVWSFQDGIPSTSTDTFPTVSFTSPGPKVVTLSVDAFGCTATFTDTIWVFPEPNVMTGANVAVCEGEGGAQILAVAGGGTPGYFYTWTCNAPIGFCGIDSLYDNDPQVNPSSSTWYFVQVTDTNGCQSNFDSVFVTVNPKPVVDAGPDVFICGDSAPCQILNPSIISGGGPFSYQWFPAAGLNNPFIFNPCARPDTTTIYTLVATDISTGCSSAYTTLDTLSSTTVHVHPRPIADAGPDMAICFGDSIQLQGTGSGAGPNYTYQWTPAFALSNPNSSSPVAYPGFSVEYTLVVWSNGCPSYGDTTLLRVHTIPSVDAGWDREICLGDSTMLDATAGGDSTASYTFTWSNSLGLNNANLEDPIATPVSTTTYSVVATSNWGCASISDSVTVHLRPTPIAEAGPNLQICEGETTILQGNYYYGATDSVDNPSQIYYHWSPAATLNDSSISHPFANPTQSTWYYLTVDYNVCETVDSVLLTVIPELGASMMADTTTICQGDSVLLSAQGGFGNAAYQWLPANLASDPNASSTYFHPQDSGWYQLVLLESGCRDTLDFQLNVIPKPVANFASSPAIGCAPHTLSLISLSDNSLAHVWQFGDGSQPSNLSSLEHIYQNPGSYLLQLTTYGLGGCSSEPAAQQIEVHEAPDPQLSSDPLPPATLYLPAAALQLAAEDATVTSITWDFGDGQQSTALQASHNYQEPGVYFVTAWLGNAAGCRSQASIGPFQVLFPDLFIPNVFSPDGDGQNDRFLVEYSGSQPFELQIHDRWGALRYQSKDKLAAWDGKWNGSDCPEGTYYYSLSIGGKQFAGMITLIR